MSDTCKTCRFWLPESGYPMREGLAFGECRLRGPVHYPQTPHSKWPTTVEGDWCGDHEPREPVDAP